ncbi:MAG: glycine zipper 2TM domain-containing protein [Alphaproteobacteria bacterium]|nr:glycine zipper 2TM domain-containing protein [Alphaproteobacteria bacterium]
MKKILILSVVALELLSLGGCARNISSSSYDARKIGAASQTFECVVVSVRKVAVEEGDYLEDNKVGALMGGAAGGVLGNMIGGGRGRTAATVVGALAGAAGGAMAEKHLKSQNGLEYTVKLKSGEMRTVVQGLDNPLYQGQSALLIIDNNRARVVPKNY